MGYLNVSNISKSKYVQVLVEWYMCFFYDNLAIKYIHFFTSSLDFESFNIMKLFARFFDYVFLAKMNGHNVPLAYRI
jgi:hypothetical protein